MIEYEDFITKTNKEIKSELFTLSAQKRFNILKYRQELLRNNNVQNEKTEKRLSNFYRYNGQIAEGSKNRGYPLIEQLTDQEVAFIDKLRKNRRITLLSIGLLVSLFSVVIVLFLRKRAKNMYLHSEKEKEFMRQRNALEKTQAQLEGQVEERKKIAKELHDEVANSIASLQYKITAITDIQFEEKKSAVLTDTKTALSLIYQKVRNLSHIIDMPNIERHSTKEILENIIEEYENMATFKIDYAFEPSEKLNELNPDNRKHVYLLLQELLLNARKHSFAELVSLSIAACDNEIIMIFEDNGLGVNSEAIDRGFNSLRDRVSLLQGSIDINSSNGNGTSILIEFPIHTNQNAVHSRI